MRPVAGLDMDSMQINYMAALLSPLPRSPRPPRFRVFQCLPDPERPCAASAMLNKSGDKMYPPMSLRGRKVSRWRQSRHRQPAVLPPPVRIEVGDDCSSHR